MSMKPSERRPSELVVTKISHVGSAASVEEIGLLSVVAVAVHSDREEASEVWQRALKESPEDGVLRRVMQRYNQ